VISAASSESAHFQNRSAIFNFTPVQNDLQGYFWEFPSWRNRQPTFNLGVYDSRMAAQFPRARLLDILKAGLENSGKGSINIKPKGHPIHLFSPVNHFSLKRMLLVGDALGAEPLFGEGIGPALGLGKIAAETIQNAFDRDDFTFRNYRWRVLNSRVGRYLLARWLAAWSAYRLCRWPIFMHFLWSAGKFSATLWPKPSKM
jgi:flavin-dependent dehydrogenase